MLSTGFCALVVVLAAAVRGAPTTPRPDGLTSGEGTWYAPDLGACGGVNSSDDMIVAVSTDVFNGFPGAGVNPNENPICGQTITAYYQDNAVTVTVMDECEGCDTDDLDFSPAAFSQLADLSVGRIDITWSFD
ncbi:hypothetical protein BV25DRAFT_1547221 [Artomyces pyxidatus]|uniref:Uncharacterized protein n=1 Tax=Artomyces pyxidatus TaxID=48021 RepID=A0ACB8SLS6_9AGAM|nr:hypothetical protein BV25DRAFT_1547221 [Artomyces pyxidatus]